uniref:Uncharacterized protein n=1 Tax=Anguilla anguilla TaxID=7936 RepID=A0A0E9QKD8_ANGAN
MASETRQSIVGNETERLLFCTGFYIRITWLVKPSCQELIDMDKRAST